MAQQAGKHIDRSAPGANHLVTDDPGDDFVVPYAPQRYSLVELDHCLGQPVDRCAGISLVHLNEIDVTARD